MEFLVSYDKTIQDFTINANLGTDFFSSVYKANSASTAQGLVVPNGFFISAGQSWLSVDVDYIEKRLIEAGFLVVRTTIDALPSIHFSKDDVILYTSSPVKEIREYLKNVLYFPSKVCTLIPRYELLMAHEDKGFQELLKSKVELDSLNSFYHYDLDAYAGDFPVVFKTVDGAGSSGVHLAKSKSDLGSVKIKLFSISFFRKIVLAYRKFRLSRSEFDYYLYRHKGFRPYVCQPFIDGLDSDYKILVFGSKYFGLKRYTKNGDFRASGSGKFDSLEEIPTEILDFSEKVFFCIDVPFLSLDLALKDNDCYLIEYQALNFGPLTLNNSDFFYSRVDGGWARTKAKSDLNQCYADAYVEYLSNVRSGADER